MTRTDRFLQVPHPARKHRLTVFGRHRLGSVVMSLGIFLFSLGARGGVVADVGGGPLQQKTCSSLLADPSTDPRKSTSEKQRLAAAEFLLLLIFDHPMLKDVVQRSTTSDQNLRDLFHLVNGYTIPPLDEGSYGARQFDPSGFYVKLKAYYSKKLSKTAQGLNLFKKLLKGRPDLYPQLIPMIDYYRFILQPEQYDTWDLEKRAAFARPLLEASSLALLKIVRAAISVQEQDPRPIEFPEIRTYFESQMGSRYGIDLRAWITDFKAFRNSEIEHLQRLLLVTLGDERELPSEFPRRLSSPARDLMLDWLCEYLPFVIQLREQILQASHGDVAQKRSVLLEDFPIKVFLRDQILRWSKGDFSRRAHGPPPSDGAVDGLSAYLPRLALISANSISLTDRIAEIRQSLSTTDLHTRPPLIRSRELMQSWDQILALTPPPPRFDRLKSWSLNRASFQSWKSDLLPHLNELIATSQDDLARLLDLRAVAFEIKERFLALERSLPLPSEEFPSSEDEEIQMSNLLLEQGMQILRLREDSQKQGLTSMIRIQAILRQILQQEVVGLKNEDFERQLFQLISDLPAASTPRIEPLLIPQSGR